MDSKKVIEKLAEIVGKQQKIIQKLAQAVQLPGSGDVDISGGKDPGPVNPAPPAQHMMPQDTNKRAGDLILASLPPTVKPAIASLAVQQSDVLVKFQPNRGSDQAFNAIIQTIHSLQAANKLPGQTYNVKEVA